VRTRPLSARRPCTSRTVTTATPGSIPNRSVASTRIVRGCHRATPRRGTPPHRHV
jgi:hypothetical protein